MTVLGRPIFNLNANMEDRQLTTTPGIAPGDLVVVEAEVDDDSQRLARRYFASGDQIRLEAVSESVETLELRAESVIVMGVIVGRLHFSAVARPRSRHLS